MPLQRELLAVLAGQPLVAVHNSRSEPSSLISLVLVGIAGALGPFLIFGLQAVEGLFPLVGHDCHPRVHERQPEGRQNRDRMNLVLARLSPNV